MDLTATAGTPDMVPYQKVELYRPQKMSSACRHKSNLFSIKIYDSGLDDATVSNSNEDFANLAENMKRDISNGVKALVDSIAPANTQLFKTFFM